MNCKYEVIEALNIIEERLNQYKDFEILSLVASNIDSPIAENVCIFCQPACKAIKPRFLFKIKPTDKYDRLCINVLFLYSHPCSLKLSFEPNITGIESLMSTIKYLAM